MRTLPFDILTCHFAFFLCSFICFWNRKELFQSPWMAVFGSYLAMLVCGVSMHSLWCDNMEPRSSNLYYIQHVIGSLLYFFGYWMVAIQTMYSAACDLKMISNPDTLLPSKIAVQTNHMLLFFTFVLSNVLFIEMEHPQESNFVRTGGIVCWGFVVLANVLVLYRCCSTSQPWYVWFCSLGSTCSYIGGFSVLLYNGNETIYYILEDVSLILLWHYVLFSRPQMHPGYFPDEIESTECVRVGSKLIDILFLSSGECDRIPWINFSEPKSYKTGRIDPFTKFFDNQWKKCAYCVPKWISPNVLTLAGLSLCVAGGMPAVIHIWQDYMVNGEGIGSQYFTVLWWKYILIVVGVEADWILDTMDGEHARRTGVQSCTRHVFDHITDIIQRVFTTLSVIPLLPIHDMPLAYWVPFVSLGSQLFLFVPFLRYYITGHFQLNAALRVLMHALNLYLLICAGIGGERFLEQIPMICFSAVFGLIALLAIYEYSEHFVAIYRSEFSLWMVGRLIYAPILNIILLILFQQIGLMAHNPFGVSIIIGFIQASFSNHMHASQFLKRFPPLITLETVTGYGILVWCYITPERKDAICYLGGVFIVGIYIYSCNVIIRTLKKHTTNGKRFVLFFQPKSFLDRITFLEQNSNPLQSIRESDLWNEDSYTIHHVSEVDDSGSLLPSEYTPKWANDVNSSFHKDTGKLLG